jgi:alkanesulfonate monooxygenase
MMHMLPPNLEEGINSLGVNFGIFATERRDQARREVKLFFQDGAEQRELLKYTQEDTDSAWKRRLNDARQKDELHENGCWLLPFLIFQADYPYLVGSYAEIGAKLRGFAEMNISTIILDVVADEQELDHVSKALASSGVF